MFETGGLVDELKKHLAEGMPNAEMDYHRARRKRKKPAISANGYNGKTVLTDTGKRDWRFPVIVTGVSTRC
jgi:transposase-like protein